MEAYAIFNRAIDLLRQSDGIFEYTNAIEWYV